MARKRMRRRRANSSSDVFNLGNGHNNQPTMIDGKMVLIHQIRNTDEGVLYSHAITVSRFDCGDKVRMMMCADYILFILKLMEYIAQHRAAVF